MEVRVALFTGAYNHIADGVSLTLNRLVHHLEENGFQVLVFAPSTDDPALDHRGTLVEVPSFSAPGRPDYRVSIGLSRSVKQQLAAFDPAIIHIATPDFLGRAAIRYARKQEIPAVASYHTHFSSYLKYYHLGFMEDAVWAYLRWFYGNCEQIYVPSESMVSVLKDRGITEGLLDWPRGVDTTRFHSDKRDSEWRHQHGFADDDVVISFVGRLVWEKGLDVFADVLDMLKHRNIRFKSIVVGDGPAKTELINRLPGTKFAGHLEGEDLAVAYASSDIFLFPSETETFGNVTLEAMASGVPTVCADATGSSTLVVHAQTGFLAEPKNVPSFADLTERLITDSELRHEMSRSAREQAMEYDWDAVLNRIPRYYRQLLAEKSKTSAPVAVNPSAPSVTDSAVAVH